MKRSRLFHIRRTAAAGAAPGTIISPVAATKPVIDIIAYGPNSFEEHSNVSLAEVAAIYQQQPVTWVNVSGLGDIEVIADIAKLFDLHMLAIEDVLNLHQRPKVEEFHDHLFLVCRMTHSEQTLSTEQVSMFLGRNFLLTFQEVSGDSFDPVRDRLRKGKGRSRNAGPDYLCYALIDAVIDDYFPLLERYGETLENLEAEVVNRPDTHHITSLHDMKRELLTLRRAIWPHREMVSAFLRDDIGMLAADTRIYLRDVYDHTIQLMDILETFREVASGLVDVYMSTVSNQLNQTMKVLTIIATIFIPLSFVASLYGMNFDRSVSPWNMPELGWRFGYPFALLLMFSMLLAMLFYFRRKGWFGGKKPKKRGSEPKVRG